jgi:hypothetical protein
MWIWLTATATAHATPEAISARRRAWTEQGKDGELAKRCRFQQRYVVKSHTTASQPRLAGAGVKEAPPPQVFWLLETDKAQTAELITEHFKDLWTITVQEVVPQGIGQALPAR